MNVARPVRPAPPRQILPSLEIGTPNDRYEQEADRVANQVMQSSSSEAPVSQQLSPIPNNTSIQRKCSHCEEEEIQLQAQENADFSLQRKAADDFSMQGFSNTTFATDTLGHQLAQSKGNGFNLPEPTRQKMERGIGADFSQVRLHTNAPAVQMNEDLQARAFTNGRDIYFNQGEYAPHTLPGQHLLAHELTHVVQQNATSQSPAIQRIGAGDPSFEVNRIPSPVGQRPNFIYFDGGSNTIPTEELAEIDNFVAAHLADPVINLYGYNSEEGNAEDNLTLVNERLAAVQHRMLHQESPNVSYSGTINLIPDLERSHRSIFYRQYRAVEMSVGGSTFDQVRGNATTDRDCTTDEHTIIDGLQSELLTEVNTTIQRLNEFKANPGDHPEVGTHLDHNFHSHSDQTIDTLVGHLRLISTDLAALNGNTKRRCGDDVYESCAGFLAFVNGRRMTFCPGFFVENSNRFSGAIQDQEDYQRFSFLHEMAHFTRHDANDRSYRYERVFRFLSTREALDNADSIAVFVVEMMNPAQARVDSALSQPMGETLANCDPADAEKIEEALAWAERWNTDAVSGLPQAYRDRDHFRFMLPHISRWFGAVNRYSLAGIFDRYMKLEHYFGLNYIFNCVDAGFPTCSPRQPIHLDTTTGEFTVCPTYYGLHRNKRTVLLTAELTKMIPEVLDSQREAYPQLARAFRLFFFESW